MASWGFFRQAGFPLSDQLSTLIPSEVDLQSRTENHEREESDHPMPTDSESKDISRRSFVKRTAMGGAGLLLAADVLGSDLTTATPKTSNATMVGVPFEAREHVRLGIIGVGGRGSSLLEDLLAVENIQVKAICDLVPEKVAKAQKTVTTAG